MYQGLLIFVLCVHGLLSLQIDPDPHSFYGIALQNGGRLSVRRLAINCNFIIASGVPCKRWQSV